MMRTNRSLRLAAVLLTGLAAAACESSTEPDAGTFDAEAALADYQAMQELVASMEWGGFSAMGSAMGGEAATRATANREGEAGVAALARGGTPTTAAEAAVRELLSALSRPLPTAGDFTRTPAPSRAPIISDGNRGSTFVWSEAHGHYVLDPDRTGAPSTGVRFVLYEPEGDGSPDPDVEIGHADLIDLGDGSAEDVVLQLVVEVEGLTRLDYRTSVDELENGVVVTVEGFLQDEDDRLDFDLDVSGSDGGGAPTVDIAFEMRMDSREFSIDGLVSGTEGDGATGDIDITVQHSDRSLRVDVGGTDSSVDGAFYLDGALFATVSGHPDDPVFTGADGEALDAHEVAVLLRMLAVVADTFALFGGLVAPIAPLVLLGIIF